MCIAGLAAGGGCAGGGGVGGGGASSPTADATAVDPVVVRPLAGLAGQRAILFPVQRVTGGAAAGLGADAAMRGQLDDELAFALEERGLAGGWTTGPASVRLAARNPMYTADPRTLSVPAASLRRGDPIAEPLASQLRALAALADARYAVVPLELRVDAADGTTRALLRLALADVRLAQVLWAGETSSVDLPAAPAALAARVAASFTDLIVAPPEP